MVEEVEETLVIVMVQGRKEESWNVQHINKIMWCQSFNELSHSKSVELTTASPTSPSPPSRHFHHLLDMSTTCHHIDASNCHQSNNKNRGSRPGCVWSPRYVFFSSIFFYSLIIIYKNYMYGMGTGTAMTPGTRSSSSSESWGSRHRCVPSPSLRYVFFFPLFFY